MSQLPRKDRTFSSLKSCSEINFGATFQSIPLKKTQKTPEKSARILYGQASYYASKFEGRKTTSGERYYKSKYTAAHSSLPMGTYLRVTNTSNNKSIIVKVNDRCAVRRTRIIDLSKRAAREIDIKGIDDFLRR